MRTPLAPTAASDPLDTAAADIIGRNCKAMEWFLPCVGPAFKLIKKLKTAVNKKIQNEEEREEVLRRLTHLKKYLLEVDKQDLQANNCKLLKEAVTTTKEVLHEAVDAIEKQQSQAYLKQVLHAKDNAKRLEQLKEHISYWEGSVHRTFTLLASHAEPPQAVLAKKYSSIPDNYQKLTEVAAALRELGLESSNLILGIDFTKSNEWTGKKSFDRQCLHKIGGAPNPYEQAISIMGETLASFDKDNRIPCFGFGDETTQDDNVFSFHHNNSPCHGFKEVLSCYRKIVPNVRLAGPTSFARIVEAAVDIVVKSGGQHHVLVIIADGQVTRSVDTRDGELSPQEKATVDSIVMASSYPLSIVLVGVGDGPWEDMHKFDDELPDREFDNFQFVNFTTIMSRDTSPETKGLAFALAALMEIPVQYKATMELGILGQCSRSTVKAKRVVPKPPPLPAATQSSRRC